MIFLNIGGKLIRTKNFRYDSYPVSKDIPNTAERKRNFIVHKKRIRRKLKMGA